MTKIFVIENEEQARNMLLKFLEEEGLNTSSAENRLAYF